MKSAIQPIVIASLNNGKIKEIRQALVNLPFQICLQSELNVPEIQETGLTFLENALLKARNAAKISGLPALADDSGLVIDALQGRPGIFSSRYSGENASNQENIAKVLQEMIDVPKQNRTACFYGVIVYLQHEFDPVPKIFEGRWEGEILFEAKEAGGFGYDPIFYDPLLECSAAELSIIEKNHVSHRGKALKQLIQYLKKG